MKCYDATDEESIAAYNEAVRDYLKPILIEFNEYIESACFDEYERSEDWMIEMNVNHFLSQYNEIRR